IILSTSTILWTIKDKTPPPWDPSDHLRYAYDYYRPLANLDFSRFFGEVFVAEHFYAPAVHLATAIMFLMFGASRVTGIFVNLLSLAVLLYSSWWIARRLYDSSTTQFSAAGFAAALIAVCSHFSAWLMHDAFLDFPLEAAVTAGMALLIRSGDFRVRSH